LSFDINLVENEIAKQSGPMAGFDPSAVEGELFDASASSREILGANFDPEHFASAGLRLYLSRGDTLSEKQKRIQKRHPTGEIKVMPKSPILGYKEDTLLWRESPESQWKMVEPQGFDWLDIPEAIAPSLESIIAETAMAVGSGGSSVPATVGRQALGAMFGESVEQAGQYLSGTQGQSTGGIASEIAGEGAASAVGGFLMSPLVAGKNIAQGRGALRVGEEGLETIKAAQALDPKLSQGLTPALVSDNPALRLSERQSSALLPGLQRRYRSLIDRLDTVVRRGADQKAINSAIDNVSGALDELSKSFIRRIGSPATTASAGGRALREGVEEYSKNSRDMVSGLYKAARQIEEPRFNMTGIKNTAYDLRRGSKGTIDPAIEKRIRELESIKGPIELSDGTFLSVTDQIRNIRTELFALNHVEPGKVADQTTGQSGDLLRAIKNTLDNPENANQAFRDAWKSANDAASLRFKTLEQAPVVAAAKSQNPADLVRTYARPYQSDNLLALRNTVSAEKWDGFVDSFYADILSEPGSVAKTLDSFDQETLDVLIPRADQASWRKIGEELARIDDIGAEKIAEAQVSNKRFINSLIEEANPRKAVTLIRAANNTNNAAMRQSLRSGMLEWAWDGVVTKGKNTLEVNSGLLRSRVNKLKENGLWGLLSIEERKIIGNAEIVSRAFKGVIDAGTSIQAAEQVAGLKKLQTAAIMTFIRNELVAQFYMSSMGRKMLLGSGLPNSNGAMLRLLGGTLAQTLPPEDISQLAEE